MDIGGILKQAWAIIWKHKILWIFGILAACGSASGNNISNSYSRKDNVPFQSYQFEQFFETIPGWQLALIIAVIILVILLITILVIFLSTIGKIGLVRGTHQADQGQEKLNFGELFSTSGRYFWRVFFLNLIVGLLVMVLGITIVIAYIGAAIVTLGILGICLLPFICLLAPLGWLLNIVVQQAIVAIVVEDLGIGAGFQRGWDVFRRNIGPYLLMGVVLLLISLVVGAVLGLPTLLIVAPALTGYALGNQQVFNGTLIFALVCFVLYFPVLLLGSGILTAFTNSAWTLTFLRLTGQKPEAAPELQPETL